MFEEDNVDDVEMFDIEEGECVDCGTSTDPGQLTGTDVKAENPEAKNQSENRKGKSKKKKKNKKRKSKSGANFKDIDRFVWNTCKRLRENKSYMVYTAVGCLGISALSDLVREVDAIQACGGQMTADGRRPRTGGGILWNIIKTREPNAYKEIMEQAKKFEKQFSHRNVKQASGQKPKVSDGARMDIHETPKKKTDGPDKITQDFAGVSLACSSDGSRLSVEAQSEYQHGDGIAETKRVSVHDRTRIPVSYDDALLNIGVDST